MGALTLAAKDLRIFFGQPGQVVMLLVLPLVFVVAFGAIFGLAGTTEEVIPLQVSNGDGTAELARELVGRLSATAGLDLAFVSEREGLAAIESEDSERLLIIPEGFTGSVQAGNPTSLRIVTGAGANADQTEAVRAVVDGIARDLSLENQLVSALDRMGAMMAMSPEGQETFAPDIVRQQAASQFERAKTNPLISIEAVLPSRILAERERFSATDLSVPGLAVLFVFLTATGTAASLFRETKEGTFRRLLVSPLGKAEMLAGKMLPNVVKTLLQIAVIFVVGRFLLPAIGVPALSGGRPGALVVVSVLIAICSSALGLLLAAIARKESQISTVGTVILWVMGAVSGAFIPQFFLGGFLGAIGRVVPHFWAISAFQDILVRGEGLAGIGTQLAVLAGFTVVFGAIGAWRFRFGDEA